MPTWSTVINRHSLYFPILKDVFREMLTLEVLRVLDVEPWSAFAGDGIWSRRPFDRKVYFGCQFIGLGCLSAFVFFLFWGAVEWFQEVWNSGRPPFLGS